MATEHNVVCHDHSVTDFAVVCHVGASHHVAVVTNLGDTIFLFSGAIDRHRLAEYISVANDYLSGCALVAQILRLGANYYAWEEMVFTINRRKRYAINQKQEGLTGREETGMLGLKAAAEAMRRAATVRNNMV